MSLSACSNWSKRDRNTAIGAGAGALGGAVLTDGSTLGTLGGAAVGGIIGHRWANNHHNGSHRHNNILSIFRSDLRT